MPYRAPVEEYTFLFQHIVGLDTVSATQRFEDATPDTVAAILTEAGKMCEEVLARANRAGDLTPARLENGVVRTSPGYSDAYEASAAGGWVSIAGDPE